MFEYITSRARFCVLNAKTDVCVVNQRGNILSPGKSLVLSLHLQQCQEYSKDKWESCLLIMFLFIYT